MADSRASCAGQFSASSTERALRSEDSNTSRSTSVTPRSRSWNRCVTLRARAMMRACGKFSRTRSTISSDCSMSSTATTMALAEPAPAVRSKSSRVASP
jgi:hypothetical protein